MDNATPPPRWYHVWRAQPAPEADTADLGTAFGLELSLGDSLYDPPAAPAAAPRSLVSTTPRWMPRLGRRPDRN